MPSQSTERKKTCLVRDRCCTLVNSFLNRAIVTTCPGLPYIEIDIQQHLIKVKRNEDRI